MPAAFDPYYQWLAIPPDEQPPNHYRLLGLKLFEANGDVIDTSADRQMAHVRSFQTGDRAADSQRLLNELATARRVLLDPQKKSAYDSTLKAGLATQATPTPNPPASVATKPAAAKTLARAVPLVLPSSAAESESVIASLADDHFTKSVKPIRRPAKRKSGAPVLLAAGGVGVMILAVVGWLAFSSIDNKATEPQRSASSSLPPAIATQEPALPDAAIATRDADLPADADGGPKPVAQASDPSPTETPADPKPIPAVVSLDRPDALTPDPTPTVRRPAVFRGPKVDLLKRIEPARDSIVGQWRFEQGALITPQIDAALMLIPFTPAPSYQIEAVFERRSGNDLLGFGLVVGGTQVLVVLDQIGKFGLMQIDGQTWYAPETARAQSQALASGILHNVRCRVEPGQIAVEFDGRTLLEWSGDASRLALPATYAVTKADHLFLAEWHSQFRIVSLTYVRGTEADAPASARLPVPSKDVQQDAVAQIHKLLRSDFTAARTADERRALAEKLFGLAEDSHETAERFCLLSEARRTAVAAQAPALAFAIAEVVAAEFEVDRWELLNQVAAELATKALPSPAALEYCNAVLGLVEESQATEQHETARRLAVTGLNVARKAKLSDQVKLFTARVKKADVQKRKSAIAGPAAASPHPKGEIGVPDKQELYLKELKPKETQLWGTWTVDFEPVHLAGKVAPHGITMHPEAQSTGKVVYELPEGYRWFVGMVGINEIAAHPDSETPLTLHILGDGRELWRSRPHATKGDVETFDVDVRRVKQLTLTVDCPGANFGAHAAWGEPRLITASARAAKPATKSTPAAKGQGPQVAASSMPAPQIGKWFDLLAVIDPAKQHREAGWQRTPDGWRAKDDLRSLQLPVETQGEFELHVEFTRLVGSEAVNIVFPAGPVHNTQLLLDGLGGGLSGLVTRDGSAENVGKRLPHSLQNHHRHEVDITVKDLGSKWSVRVLLDGAPYTEWQGKADLPTTGHGWGVVGRYSFGLGAQDETIFHVARLKMLSGTATVNPALTRDDSDTTKTRKPAGSPDVVYLRSLEPQELRNNPEHPLTEFVAVGNVFSTNGLLLHPPSANSSGHVAYALDAKFKSFVGGVGINDAIEDFSHSPLTFRIVGDGRELWKSSPLQKRGEAEQFAVAVAGVKQLELFVDCPGADGNAHGAWTEPRLMPTGAATIKP